MDEADAEIEELARIGLKSWELSCKGEPAASQYTGGWWRDASG